ncbi:MAG TPA: ParB/RepB/Spo0J family partition protein [Herpetosiphonaceae bacterium]
MNKRRGFFSQQTRPEDPAVDARTREVEALFVPRRSALQDVPLDRIHPNPFQARHTFDQIEELAEAIRVQGFVSRLRLRPHPDLPGHFQLVFGERRLRAAQRAGLVEVPCEISEHSDAEMAEIGLTENIQRRDLDPLEEARALQAVIEMRGYTIASLADRLGKSKGYINNRLALLRMPDDVQQLVAQQPHTLRAALDIRRVDDAGERAAMIAELQAGNLSGNQVRDQVRQAAPSARSAASLGGAGAAQVSAAEHRRLVEQGQLTRTFVREWMERARTNRDRDFLAELVLDLIGELEALAEELQG